MKTVKIIWIICRRQVEPYNIHLVIYTASVDKNRLIYQQINQSYILFKLPMRIDVKCEKRVRLKCIYLKSQSQ